MQGVSKKHHHNNIFLLQEKLKIQCKHESCFSVTSGMLLNAKIISWIHWTLSIKYVAQMQDAEMVNFTK